MVPHERSLVKKYAGQPFAIVGVNSDPLPRFRQAKERERMTWRSFWDGGSTEGPISTRWAVSAWPTVYLIDPQGVIRYKNVHGEELEQAIDQLLAEAVAGGS